MIYSFGVDKAGRWCLQEQGGSLLEKDFREEFILVGKWKTHEFCISDLAGMVPG